MRKLPVYFLIDVSESMVGEPIAEVEKGMHGIINELRGDPYALETVWVAVLVFAGKAEILEPLTELIQFKPPPFPIGSGTSLGKGLELLMDDLDRNVRKTTCEKKGDWKPMIFLFTDGAPTDDPDRAVKRWVKDYRTHCNLLAITFGDHADIPLLERLSNNVLTLKDTSPQSFKEFFKWVTASIQVSSMAVSDAGDDGSRLARTGINLEKARPSSSMDENFATLLVKCSNNKKVWLAKYKKKPAGYDLVGGYAIDEAKYNALGGKDSQGEEIAASLIASVPQCPCCGRSHGIAHCGQCNQLFCIGNKTIFTCPWCGSKGEIAYGSDFNVSRGQG